MTGRACRRLINEGRLRTQIDTPVGGFFAPAVRGIATDSRGNVLVNYQEGDGGSLLTYTPSGELIGEFAAVFGDFALDRDDRVFARTDTHEITVFDSEGFAVDSIDIPEREHVSWRDHGVTTGGQVVVSGTRFDPSTNVETTTGVVLSRSGVIQSEFDFSADADHIAVGDDTLYARDGLTGTIRGFSLSGEPVSTAYAIPEINDLTIGPDGLLVAAMPDARVVERITQERYEP